MQRWGRDLARLDAFFDAAPTDRRWAVEFRDRSWLTDETFQLLTDHGAALCVHDLVPDHPWVRTTDWAYVRFHGPAATEAPYHGAYGPRGLEKRAEHVRGWLADGCDVYAYFNNDIGGHAWTDARWLAGALEEPPPAGGGLRGAGNGQVKP